MEAWVCAIARQPGARYACIDVDVIRGIAFGNCTREHHDA